MTTKEAIIKTIGCLPDDVSIDEIVTCIQSLKEIREADEAIDRNEGLEHAFVMDKIRKLL